MSWSISLTDVGTNDIREKTEEVFKASYPEPASGIELECEEAEMAAESIMYDAFSAQHVDYQVNRIANKFSVQMSGHTRTDKSDGAESFVSVIVTLRKREDVQAQEVEQAEARSGLKEPANA